MTDALRTRIATMKVGGYDTQQIAGMLNVPEQVVYNTVSRMKGTAADQHLFATTAFIDPGGVTRVPARLWFHPMLPPLAKLFYAFMAAPGRPPMPVTEVFVYCGEGQRGRRNEAFATLEQHGFVVATDERMIGDQLVGRIFRLDGRDDA